MHRSTAHAKTLPPGAAFAILEDARGGLHCLVDPQQFTAEQIPAITAAVNESGTTCDGCPLLCPVNSIKAKLAHQ